MPTPARKIFLQQGIYVTIEQVKKEEIFKEYNPNRPVKNDTLSKRMKCLAKNTILQIGKKLETKTVVSNSSQS